MPPKNFLVHESVIVKIDYFKIMITTNKLEESTPGVANFPEDDLDAMELTIAYAYLGRQRLLTPVLDTSHENRTEPPIEC